MFENSLDKWKNELDRWSYGSHGFYETLWGTDALDTDTLYGEAKVLKRETSYDESLEQRLLTFQVGDLILQKVGWYNSWDSNDWSGDIYEVRPREVTVTIYEKT